MSDAETAPQRIAKWLAHAGVASRRDAELLIAEGRVCLNGAVVTTPATKVSAADLITVDGDVIGGAQASRLWRYYKPAGLVTTHKDPQGRPTVFDHLPDHLPRVISVGRLDLNTEGLLLLTTDGELARHLELPANGYLRQYRVRALGQPDPAALEALKDGVTIDGIHYGLIDARILKAKPAPEKSRRARAFNSAAGQTSAANIWLSIAITEGKNREVRKVLSHLGMTVNRLIRQAYGPFSLEDLEPGEVAEVSPRALEKLGLKP